MSKEQKKIAHTGLIHIFRVPTKEVLRERHGHDRFCFVCRKRQQFDYVVKMPTDPDSYYGPDYAIECSNCRTGDADLFPGRTRGWD